MGSQRTFVLALAAAGILATAPEVSAQAGRTAPVTGTAKGKNGKEKGTFEGTFTLTGFRTDGEDLLAVGTLDGTVTNDKGKVVREIEDVRVALPVDLEASGIGVAPAAAGEEEVQAALLDCDVLNLVLGPLDLNLLGLEVSLNQVILGIVANPLGGLLGQILTLLCGLNLAGLLALLGSLGPLVNLLNLLLGLFF